MFKKRTTTSKNNIRKRDTDVQEDVNENASDAVGEVNINEIKLQQSMRSRNAGTALENLMVKKKSVDNASDKARQSNEKTLETVMGTQFSLQSESGQQSGMMHDKMMEKYIADKLGVNEDNSKQDVKVLTEDDKLYLVPEEIKRMATGGREQSDELTSDGITTSGSACSAGIAEVSLPASFQLRNIAATAAVVEKLRSVDYLAEAQKKQRQSGYYQRFQTDHRALSQSSAFVSNAPIFLGVDESEIDVTEFSAIAAAAAAQSPVETVAPAKTSGGESNKRKKSSDDLAMEKFKKQQHFRR